MRIGYVVTNFPPVSETFVRREANALCAAGHRVTVYTNRRHSEPEIEKNLHPSLAVTQTPFSTDVRKLALQAEQDGIEHLHGSLMFNAHRACFEAAVLANIPFTLRVYSGYDVFSRRNPDLYREISRHPLCDGLIVEDPFMRDWLVERLGAEPSKVEIVGNSFDLDLYRATRPRDGTVPTILAIARFVEKKGLIFLVEACQLLRRKGTNARLRIAGSGPEENALRRAAAGNDRIEFLGVISEQQCRAEYAAADIFCLPCIQSSDGDADGIPTTVLEAMGFALPVVTSNLLSAPFYVRHESEGLLTPPGDIDAICSSLQKLCLDSDLRKALGEKGRQRVSDLCDLSRNIGCLEEIMVRGRRRRWQEKLDTLLRQRTSYSAERERYYEEKRRRAMQFLRPFGKMLDLGCGDGDVRFHVNAGTEYVGCDPVPIRNHSGNFPFYVASGESLPFPDTSFDCVLLYSTLGHTLDVDRVLAEAHRVLKPGGLLLLHEYVNDPNPLHLNHITAADLQGRVAGSFKVLESKADGPHFLLMRAQKSRLSTSAQVSIAITTFNRERFLRECIESVLRQTYRPVELVIVDDGSSDGTGRILENYHQHARIVHLHHQGIAAAKNEALRSTSSSASYVGILDSDDYFHPQFVERCVEKLESDPAIGLVYTDDILVDVGGRELWRRQALDPWSIDGWLRGRNLRGDTWLARRELVMRTSLHDELLSHDVDYDLFYQLLEITTFARVPGHLVYIRRHNGQTTRNQIDLAKCHAANLVKYGYSPEYAYLRARRNPEWVPAIEAGIEIGKQLRAKRQEVL